MTLLPFLGLTDFHTKGEPREAIVAYSMLDTGNWILPSNAGGDMAYKPPFFHWCIAALSLPFGEVSEYTSRLPSALALIFMMGALFLFFAKRIDPYKSFLASLLCISSFEVHRAAMNARVDMVMTAFIVLALIQLYKWWENDLKGIPFWGILFMSCGFLTKGPIGFLLPCGATGLFLLFNRISFLKTLGKMALAALLSCILPALWYYMAYQQGGQEFLDLVMEENFGRFLGKMSYDSHVRPASYNFVTVFSGYIPWTLLVLFTLFVLPYRRMRLNFAKIWSDIRDWFYRVDRARLFSLLTIVVIFIFYCIPKSKRSVYLLPIYPFIGLFLADLAEWLIKYKVRVWKVFGWVISGITVLALALLALIKTNLLEPEHFLSPQTAAKLSQHTDALQTAPLTFISVVSIIVALTFVFAFVRDIRFKMIGAKLMFSVIGLVFGMQILLDGTLQPAILNYKSTKGFAAEVAAIVPEGKVYGFINDRFLRYYIINYYIDNRVYQFEDEMPREGYLLLGENTYPLIQERYGNEYEFAPVIRTPHNDTELKDYIILYQFKKIK